jgi:hypothetical protein
MFLVVILLVLSQFSNLPAVAMPEADSIEIPTPAKKIRRSFTSENKLEIDDHTKSISTKATNKKFKIDKKNIR